MNIINNLIKRPVWVLAMIVWIVSPYTAMAAEAEKLPVVVEPVAAIVEPVGPQYKVVSTSVNTITSYTSEAAQTDASPCITANGFNLCKHGIEDSIAANFLPFGTRVRIPELFGDRIFIVRDRMHSRFKTRVDVWMRDKDEAIHFGLKNTKIEVVEEIK